MDGLALGYAVFGHLWSLHEAGGAGGFLVLSQRDFFHGTSLALLQGNFFENSEEEFPFILLFVDEKSPTLKLVIFEDR